MKTGVELIAEERERQRRSEGWSDAHDDEHDNDELRDAAEAYLKELRKRWIKPRPPISPWPWDKEWWKPTKDPVRQLVKAGALIAAEIDRLQRMAERGPGRNG